MNTHVKVILSLVTAFLLIACMAGCHKNETATTPSGTTTDTAAQTTVTSSAEPTETSAQTTPSDTTTAASETTTAAETTTGAGTTAVPAIYYAVLPAGKEASVDLNDDGRKERLLYSCPDEYHFSLSASGASITRDGDNFLSGWFFLVDLDSEDPYIDIAVQECGPSDDYQVTLFYFDGSSLVLRGVVPGTICAIGSATIVSDPLGTGDIQFDGHGGLTAFARGHVLQTWFYDEPWKIGDDLMLVKIPQDYYPIRGYDPDTDEVLPEMPVKMKRDLPLAGQPGSDEIAAIARSGQNAFLVKTDDSAWIQLRTQSGVLGWFRVDGFNVLINGISYFSDDVFDGLTFAD